MSGPNQSRKPAPFLPPSTQTNPTALDISILDDDLAPRPAGYTEAKDTKQTPTGYGINHNTNDRNLVGHMPRFREAPLDFLRDISLHVSGTGWRSYDDVLGQPIFYRGFTERMTNAVMANPLVGRKVADLANRRIVIESDMGLLKTEREQQQRREDVEASLRQVSERLVDQMICKMESKKFIRGAYYMVTQLLTRAYHQGIHVSSEEVLRLRAVAEKAAKEGQSIIFLPCHRSHVDYVSLQLICYRLGLALPIVVAGENLNIPLLGPFLQHAGAMWIRRSFGDDQLYVTLVQAYIDTLLQEGFNFECFVEGGRSRTGKLLPPKFGILSFLLDSVLSGRVKDAIICPVSTQYDKVIEVDSYITELLGKPKVKENLADFLSASSVLSLKLGRIDARFHEPWSLRSFINQQAERAGRRLQMGVQGSYDAQLRLRLLRTLGFKVLSDINAVSVVMPTALIGTVLLTLRGRGVGKSELVRRVEWLSERVRNSGGRVAHFANQPTSLVVDRGLDVLGPKLVGRLDDVAEDTFYAVDRFQLSFYRNMTIHLFISQALVSAALYSRVKVGGSPEGQAMPYADLFDYVSFLSQLFRGEFIFPTEGLAVNLSQTLAGLEKEGVVRVTWEDKAAAASAQTPASSPVDTHTASSIQSIELSKAERLSGRENFDFYCFMIWPFIEATWLGAVSLLMLTPPVYLDDQLPSSGSAGRTPLVWLPTAKIQAAAQLLGKTLYGQGDLSYFEAVNKEVLKNAYDRFEDLGILLISKAAKKQSSTPAPAPAPSSSDQNASTSTEKPKPKPPASSNPGVPLPSMARLADDWTPAREVIPTVDGPRAVIIPRGKLWDFCEKISSVRLEGKNRRDGTSVRSRLMALVERVGDTLWEEQRRALRAAFPDLDEVSGVRSAAEEDARQRGRRRRKGPVRATL